MLWRQVAGRYKGPPASWVFRVGKAQLGALNRRPGIDPALIGDVIVGLQALALGQLQVGDDEVQL